jgi:replication factor C subunit 1
MFREGIKLPPQVVDALIEGSRADIRQIINMISTAKLDQKAMDFDQGKEMSKAWQKHVILKPWDIVAKIMGGQMFSPSSTATLNDKIELYFNDHEMSHLMLQRKLPEDDSDIVKSVFWKRKNLKQLGWPTKQLKALVTATQNDSWFSTTVELDADAWCLQLCATSQLHCR